MAPELVELAGGMDPVPGPPELGDVAPTSRAGGDRFPRMPALVAPLLAMAGSALLAACQSQVGAFEDPVRVAEAERPGDGGPNGRPSVQARLWFDHPDAVAGPGSLSLRGNPWRDELEVHLVVGLPVRAARWQRCPRLELATGDRRLTLPARWRGVAMSGGRRLDALTGRVPLPFLRAVRRDGQLELLACGRRISLHRPDLDAVDRFLERFDDRARHPPPPPRLPNPLVHPPSRRAGESLGSGRIPSRAA
ncbi:MAG TPA: hypothetical protein RMF84_07965 [Polyangiaceae bacterium LLY-WYZ-14_1]|nr:hypothetical protein [Polyangiaceae bacterium LLY-WYZ-14_1]